MKPVSSDNKFSEVEQGDVPLGLSEYLSRGARFKLVKVLIKEIEGLLDTKKDSIRKNQLNLNSNSREGASKVLADELGVSKQTVNRWLKWDEDNEDNRVPLSCNANAEKLLKVGMKYASEQTFFILEEDLEEHRTLFEDIIGEVEQGGVPLHKIPKLEQGAIPL